jgi:hypothetical protein
VKAFTSPSRRVWLSTLPVHCQYLVRLACALNFQCGKKPSPTVSIARRKAPTNLHPSSVPAALLKMASPADDSVQGSQGPPDPQDPFNPPSDGSKTTTLPFRPAIKSRSSGQHSALAKSTLKKALEQGSQPRTAVSAPATPQVVVQDVDSYFSPLLSSECDEPLSMGSKADNAAQSLTVNQLPRHGVGPAASDTPQPSLPGSPGL